MLTTQKYVDYTQTAGPGGGLPAGKRRRVDDEGGAAAAGDDTIVISDSEGEGEIQSLEEDYSALAAFEENVRGFEIPRRYKGFEEERLVNMFTSLKENPNKTLQLKLAHSKGVQNTRIRYSDIQSLRKEKELEDYAINSLFRLLCLYSLHYGKPNMRCWNFSSFTVLRANDDEFITRIIDAEGPPDNFGWKDIRFLFFVKFVGEGSAIGHWILGVADTHQKTLKVYDSLHSSFKHTHGAFRHDMLKILKQCGITYTFRIEDVSNALQQYNGIDCGVFALMNAEMIMRGTMGTLRDVHVPYFRYMFLDVLLSHAEAVQREDRVLYNMWDNYYVGNV